MRNLLNPKWLFVINTLPVAILFFIFYGQFHIVKTLLDEPGIIRWKAFGLGLAILGLLTFGYAAYLSAKRQKVSLWYGFAAMVVHILFIYLYLDHSDKMLPSSIPQWIVPQHITLYPATFLMPTLVYALFMLVAHFTPEAKSHSALKNFLTAAGMPVAMFLLFQIILPLSHDFNNQFLTHVFIVLFIAVTVLFLFFLVRCVYILAIKKSAAWKEYELFWKIPISILFPFIGLLLNNGISGGIDDESGIFGNFSSPSFYFLGFINGILICVPNLRHKTYRLFLFIGRSIMFTYSLYFFFVFLPFLPLSVLAVIIIGTGFLMLTPLLLFVLHSNELTKDFRFLSAYYSPRLIMGIALAAFMVIPACITASYIKDKHVLNETLDYLYSPDYSKQYNIDRTSLKKTLHVVKQHRDRNNDFSDSQTPYLSSYFNWIVLDNLTLSNTKINTIDRIFFDNSTFQLRPDNIANKGVRITHLSSGSVYDQSQQAWKSTVDLSITNSNSSGIAEYATTIDLPDGCWISDYYLYVGDRKEPGILAEKKTATWVFSQIRNENRDPGILYYLTGNKVAFRIFPFAKNEVRKTGIEFLHKEPVKLTIDDQAIVLGDSTLSNDEPIENGDVIYISARQKQALKLVKRKPYFHFLVDVSKEKRTHISDFIDRIEKVMEKNPSFSMNAKVSFVNSYVHTVPLNSSWAQAYHSQSFDGGFYLGRAINTALYNAYQNKSYPLLVVVTDSMENAIIDEDFSDLRFTFPESDLFYEADGNGELKAHSLINDPARQLPDSSTYSLENTVLAYPLGNNSIAYLPNDGKPSIVLKKDIIKPAEADIKEKTWQSALAMQGQWISQALHPEHADEEWGQMVRHSFQAKIMTPVTAYLVVENDAQKAALKKKQEQVLSGNKSLDLGDDAERMTEPGLGVLAILLVLALWYTEKRKRRLAGK